LFLRYASTAVLLRQIEHKKKEKPAKIAIVNRFLIFAYVSDFVLDIRIANLV